MRYPITVCEELIKMLQQYVVPQELMQFSKAQSELYRSWHLNRFCIIVLLIFELLSPDVLYWTFPWMLWGSKVAFIADFACRHIPSLMVHHILYDRMKKRPDCLAKLGNGENLDCSTYFINIKKKKNNNTKQANKKKQQSA